LPSVNNGAKREFEIYALKYSAIWIGVFAIIIVLQLYEDFTADSYLKVCVSLALPFLLQPIVFPNSSERKFPFYLRYSFKANLWIAIYSFIGNYWYTHYFYSVLKAKYTFPAHRLNDVPIALYFATHFYFVTYHTLSNMMLRKIESRYVDNFKRKIFFWLTIFAFSYFTAFMETLTISSFPYYSFEDRNAAYLVGSAFYGLYFIVSFPMFYRVDEYVSIILNKKNLTTNDVNDIYIPSIVLPHSISQVVFEAFGACMMILLLLDFSRLFANVDLFIPGKAFYLFQGLKNV
jgi:cycloeucalenol cycloisomerase